MVKNKKAEVTFSQIVIAALALIVLVVMIMIFTGQMGKLAKMFGLTSDATETEASKTSWCLSTITSGKRCEYNLDCAAIAAELDGTGQPLGNNPNLETDCKGPGQIRTYSKSMNEFCCVKRS